MRKDKEFEQRFFTENRQSKRKTINLVMWFKAEARPRVEECFNEKNIKYEKDGTLLVNVSYPEDEWLYSFILEYLDKNQIEVEL